VEQQDAVEVVVELGEVVVDVVVDDVVDDGGAVVDVLWVVV